MPRAALFAIALIWALSAPGAATTFDLRLRVSSSQPDAIAPGVRFVGNLSERWRWSAAAQLALSPKDIRHLAYQGALLFFPWTPLSARLASFHNVLPAIGAGSTGLVGTLAVDSSPQSQLSVFGAFGWYERLSQAAGAGMLPLPSSESEREHDFVFRLGVRAPFADAWTGTLEAASFDEYEVYNLNGPFFQLAVDHKRTDGELWRAYARYRMLLGFGRLNEFVAGAEITLAQ